MEIVYYGKDAELDKMLEECYQIADEMYENGREIVDREIREYGSDAGMLRSIRRHLVGRKPFEYEDEEE
jgi:hypothetical protein